MKTVAMILGGWLVLSILFCLFVWPLIIGKINVEIHPDDL